MGIAVRTDGFGSWVTSSSWPFEEQWCAAKCVYVAMKLMECWISNRLCGPRFSAIFFRYAPNLRQCIE